MDKGAKIDVFNFMPKSNQGNDQCSLCFNPKNGIFAFQPCGHANACKSCCVKLTFLEARDLKKCPICRTNVTHFQKIYLWKGDTNTYAFIILWINIWRPEVIIALIFSFQEKFKFLKKHNLVCSQLSRSEQMEAVVKTLKNI